jgi:hypothetical protein
MKEQRCLAGLAVFGENAEVRHPQRALGRIIVVERTHNVPAVHVFADLQAIGKQDLARSARFDDLGFDATVVTRNLDRFVFASAGDDGRQKDQ